MPSLTRFFRSQRIRIHTWRAFLFLAAAVVGMVSIFGNAGAARAALLYLPAITAVKTDSFVGGDGNGKADPGETILYTVEINNGDSAATGVTYIDAIDPNTTLVNGSVSASPAVADDTYPQTVIGDAPIDSSLIPYSVVTNDYLGYNPGATISAYDSASAQGGTVTMTTSGAGIGQFTYDPPPGFTGADTFTYTLSDNPNATSALANRQATVTINVSEMAGFINNPAAAASNVSLSRPAVHDDHPVPVHSFGGGPRIFGVLPMPSLSGETVIVSIGDMPANKSVAIAFQVTVNGPQLPFGVSTIVNQGAVRSNELPDALTTNGGPPDCETGSETCTPVNRPNTTAASITRDGPGSTNASSVSWTVTFSTQITDLAASNFALANTGLSGVSISSVIPYTASPDDTWTVTANIGAGEGALGLDMLNDAGLSHDVTNLPYTGEVYTIDRTPPAVMDVTGAGNSGCMDAGPWYCNAGDVVHIQVAFSEAVNVAGAPQLALNSGGTATYVSGTNTSTLTFDYSVAAGENANNLDYTDAGALTLNGGSIGDAAANAAALTLPSPGQPGSLGANANIVIDTIAPSVLSITRYNPGASPTNADLLEFEAAFSEEVTNVAASDFVAAGTTTQPDHVANITPNIAFGVALDGADGTPGDLANLNGVVGLNLNAAAGVADLAGNPLVVAEPATDQTYTVDNSAPTVTVEQAAGQIDPTLSLPIHFTAAFSEPVVSFTSGDVSLGGSANPLAAVVVQIAPNDGTTYDIAVTGVSNQGAVTAGILAGAAQDAAGNANAASTSVDHTVMYANHPPVIAEGDSAPVAMTKNGYPVPFTLALHAADADHDPLAWDIQSPASRGVAGVAAGTGMVSYKPNSGYVGADSFIVRVSDGRGGADGITVNVVISNYTGSLLWNQSYDIEYDGWYGVFSSKAMRSGLPGFGESEFSLGIAPAGYRRATSGAYTFKPVFAFSKFQWVTYRGPNQGKARVFVDGAAQATVDLYNPIAQWQYKVTVDGLANAPHTIVIKALNVKNASSTGKWVAVDGFFINGVGYDDDLIKDARIAVAYGTWVGLLDPSALFGAYRQSGKASAHIGFAFNGAAFDWIAARGPSCGQADVYIDGMLARTVDLYNPTSQWQYPIRFVGLRPGRHVVRIVVRNTKNPASTGFGVVSDGFIIN
jgi:uncharacterized repeat protein (TIGR01451 family)